MTSIHLLPSILVVGMALVTSFGFLSVALRGHLPSRTRRMMFVLSFVLSVVPLGDAHARLRDADDARETRSARMGVVLFTTLAVGSGLMTVRSLRRFRQKYTATS